MKVLINDINFLMFMENNTLQHTIFDDFLT